MSEAAKMTLPIRRRLRERLRVVLRIAVAQLQHRVGDERRAATVGEEVDPLGVGLAREQLDQPGQPRRRLPRSIDVGPVKRQALPRRPREADHRPATPAAMEQLGEQAALPLHVGPETVNVDVDLLVRTDRELLVDRLDKRVGSAGGLRGRRTFEPRQLLERRDAERGVAAGDFVPRVAVVAHAHVGHAEAQAVVDVVGVFAVVGRAFGGAVSGVKDAQVRRALRRWNHLRQFEPPCA